MKVLVVGGSGLVGAATSRALQERGADVISLSRSGRGGVAGDARAPGLGLGRPDRDRVRDGLTHVVSCVGSVDWTVGPSEALELHRQGTLNVLRFAATSPGIERVVHVSSILVFGQTRRKVKNADLAVGQRFRSWYEYGKFHAEREARSFESVPVRVVRLGAVLGSDAAFARSAAGGLPAALPALLRGYPLHLAGGGTFPVFLGEAVTSGEVLARAVTEEAGPDVWTWYDARLPSLAEVLIGLCAAWRVMPRIVNMPAAQRVASALAPRLGFPRELLRYTEPWVEFAEPVLEQLPDDLPLCPDGYIERAGRALVEHAAALGVAA